MHKGPTLLTPAVHDYLDDCRRLIAALYRRLTHMLEVVPPAPTPLGAHDACGNIMGDVFQGPNGTPFRLALSFPGGHFDTPRLVG